MTVSGSTLIAALLMGAPLNKPKTLEDITNAILQTLTTDPSPSRKISTHPSIPSAIIPGPSGSFVMRESGGKTKTSRSYDGPSVRAHTDLDAHTLTTSPSYSATSSFTPGINPIPQSGTSVQSMGKQILASSQMKELPSLTIPTSPLTQNLSLDTNVGLSVSKVDSHTPSLTTTKTSQETTLNAITAKTEEDELLIALMKSLETKEAEDIKRATESSKLTKTEEDNLRVAMANSLETKEAEDIQNAIEESLSIPMAPPIPTTFHSTPIDPLTSLKAHLEKNKSSSSNKGQALPDSFGAELSQALARRNKSMPISAETSQREERPTGNSITQKERPAATQVKVVTNKILSEKALRMQAFAAQSTKQERPIDLLSLIQTQKLSPATQALKVTSTHPVDVKDAVINTLHSVLKTGATLLKPSPKVEIKSAKIKTLNELKTELAVVKASGSDNFTLRALLVQIQELESTSQKINRDQIVKTVAASHQVKKVDLGDEGKEKSIKVQQALKKATPSKDDEVRQRILEGKNRSEKLAALEESNARALDAGTRSYEGPIVTLTKPAETMKDSAPSTTSAPSSTFVQAPALSVVTEPVQTAPQAPAVTAPAVVNEPAQTIPQAITVKAPAAPQPKQDEPSLDMLRILQRKMSSIGESNDATTTLSKEDVIKVLIAHQDEIGLSSEDLKIIEAQPLENLTRVIDEFYNEEDQEWNFEYALDDPKEIMSRVTVDKAKEEIRPEVKVGKLNLNKNGGKDFLSSIIAARGTIDGEDTAINQPALLLQVTIPLSQQADIAPPVAPKPPAAPKILSPKAQETVVKLAKKKEETKGGDLLDQIRNKDLHVKLKAATDSSSKLIDEKFATSKEESLEDIRRNAITARRKIIEIDDLDDEESWDN